MRGVDWSISDRRLNWKPLPFPLCFNHSVNVTIIFFIPSIHLTRVTVNDTFGVVLWGKRCLHFFSAFLDRILFILAGNDNIHESLDEFEIWPDPTTGFHGNR